MEKNIKAILLTPKKHAKILVLENSLSSFQKLVGGSIEILYPFGDPVAIICNESGKVNRMPLNRGLRSLDGMLYDTIAGPAIIVAINGENFTSLPECFLRKYYEMFKYPEVFVQNGPRIVGLLYDETI